MQDDLLIAMSLHRQKYWTTKPWPMVACLVAALVLLVSAAGAEADQSGYAGKGRNAILMDAETGAILYQQAADELMPPASMSKLATLAVVFRALKTGQLKLDDEFLMSENAWRTGGAPSGTSAMFVPVNTKATLDELLQGIVVQSGNDACISIAEGMAGSEPAFAELMTREAHRIGLVKSTFKNSTGLPADGHLMTARELALLARYIIREYPDQYALFAQKEFRYRKHRFFNRNPLLFQDIGADGLKTGYTKEAGYGMVASAVRDGRRMIAVVSGLESAEARKSEAIKLLEWGFRNFAEVKLFDADEVVAQARVWGGSQFYVPLTGKGDLQVIIPRFPASPKLKAELVYNSPLKAPIQKGDAVATLRVTTPSGATNEVPLYAAQDIGEGGIIRRGLDSLVHLAFRWVAL